MHRINLLRRKTSPSRLWQSGRYSNMKLPEVVLDGSQVVHTDEDGNILLDDNGDQRLNQKRHQAKRDREILDELAELGNDGPIERRNELAEELFAGDEIYFERMQNMKNF